ncbi:glycosyl transferase group 1 [Clostridium sp. DL-VIII]|uniref:glycosyltransferase n=1 Tax=Clostridium sp. DL-VIII TaxID=641107 RepID=UPI00023AF944|nr:glycosyltransferase [Clostridium sp. DL-VIII]EHI99330.1 glycosyl transferase group 1 [Clostridium sp. DL-VIII]
MDKLLYIECIYGNELVGVNNKINAQCNEFSKHYETTLIYPEENDICIKNFNKLEFDRIYDALRVGKLKRNYNFNGVNRLIKIIKFNLCISKLLVRENPRIIYIRKYNALNFVKTLRNFKRKNNSIIIYEIPTYPYEYELKLKRKYLSYLINKKVDKDMEKLADLIPVVLGQDVTLNCDKYIPMFNGIDIKHIHFKTNNIYEKNKINLIGIANISFWHGYDRVIEGLKNFYSESTKIKVIFNIVGCGKELDNLISLTEKYKLNDYVFFHGEKTGRDLDNIIDYCNIGIGSIANHRKGLRKDSALKNREYCARGIPFVISSRDEAFKNLKYVYKISEDETPVKIEDLIEFYSSIKNENYTTEMRNYAERNLTWETVMEPVVESINKRIVYR